MNRNQTITLIVAAVNLALMLLFPPYDYQGTGGAPTFDGFLFAFGEHANHALNREFLSIELVTVVINGVIAYLLLNGRRRLRRRMDRQNLVLLGVAMNLLLALLFPPFQDHYTPSGALLPSFDAFYFVFGDHSTRVIVPAMLWLEVIFILVNGAMFWLLFCKPGEKQMSAAERFAQSAEDLGIPERRHR